MFGEIVTRQAEMLASRLESDALAGFGAVRLAQGVQVDIALAVRIALADLDDLQQTVRDGRFPDPERSNELRRYIDWLYWVTSPMISRVMLATSQLRTYPRSMAAQAVPASCR
jgi:hypothetical protein